MKKFIGLFLIICLVVIMSLSSKYGLKKSYNTSTPREIVESYFLALSNNDYEFIKTITPTNGYVGNDGAIISTIKLIHVKEDKRNAENFIKYGMGMTKNYSDVVSFKVTYYIKHKKGEDDPTQADGVNVKWITLTKDKEDSAWIFREMGEG
jgi:hypothetical protein